MLSKIREPVNGLTHFFAAIAAGIGLLVLIILCWGNAFKMIPVSIYGISLVLLFSASSAYHLVKTDDKNTLILRKLDHSAIFLLIAGTYTPICVNMLTGFWQWGMLAIIWALALTGILVKMIVIKAPRWLTAGIYVAMGWLCLLGLNELVTRLPPGALIWLTAGGVIYTIGAIIYSTKMFNFVPGKFGFHEVWHIFVILGALAHYILVAVYIAPV